MTVPKEQEPNVAACTTLTDMIINNTAKRFVLKQLKQPPHTTIHLRSPSKRIIVQPLGSRMWLVDSELGSLIMTFNTGILRGQWTSRRD